MQEGVTPEAAASRTINHQIPGSLREQTAVDMTREDSLDHITRRVVKSYEDHGGINPGDRHDLPSKDEVSDLLEQLLGILFPAHFGLRGISRSNPRSMVGKAIHQAYGSLADLTERCLAHRYREEESSKELWGDRAGSIARGLLGQIPRIRRALEEDVQAAYDGDPAAKSLEEVITSYPSTIAIATHRLAHILYQDGVPYLPRMLSENAHSLTGIDIHPGARIGRSFFIDHGTGTVIGETAVIGDRVKLYQGVTLGALSFPKDQIGRVLKGGKRHPTIEDDAVVYSGATILGGKTIIGRGSVVGGNCWITRSIPPGTKVVFEATNHILNQPEDDPPQQSSVQSQRDQETQKTQETGPP